MPLPTEDVVQLAVQSAAIFPWNGAAGPYDGTTASRLRAIQSVDLSHNFTIAEYRGGESVHAQGAEETSRETDIRVSAVRVTLYTLSILTGEQISVGPGSSAKETQYLAPGLLDRAPYFRLECYSNVGSGILVMRFPKCKITGSLSYNQRMDGFTIPDFSARAYHDDTFTTQKGVLGAAYDKFWSKDKAVMSL